MPSRVAKKLNASHGHLPVLRTRCWAMNCRSCWHLMIRSVALICATTPS